MRAPFALAALLLLSGCGNNDHADNTQNIDENLTAENIVSNDVTAIDAVTGDAANMAADSDMNFVNLAEPSENSATPSSAARKPAPKPAVPKVQPDEPTANSVANTD